MVTFPQLHNVLFKILNNELTQLIIVRHTSISLWIPVVSQWQRGSSDFPEHCLFHHRLMTVLKTKHAKIVNMCHKE